MDRRKYPLHTHWDEFRMRMIRVMGLFAVSLCAACFLAPHIFRALLHPFAHTVGLNRLIYTHMTEAFVTYIRVGMYAAALITIPYALSQVWGFLLPGLRAHEIRAMRPLLWASPLLFAFGAGFAFLVVLPNAFHYLSSFQKEFAIANQTIALDMETRMESYLDTTFQIMCAFGVAFQIPVVMYGLLMMNVVSLDNFRQGRRIAIMIVLILSAILTPPDVLSMLALAFPMYGLYEGTILALSWIIKRRPRHA